MGTQGHLLTANQSGLRSHSHNVRWDGYSINSGNKFKYVMVGDGSNWGNYTDWQGGWDAAEAHSHNIATHQCYVFKRIS